MKKLALIVFIAGGLIVGLLANDALSAAVKRVKSEKQLRTLIAKQIPGDVAVLRLTIYREPNGLEAVVETVDVNGETKITALLLEYRLLYQLLDQLAATAERFVIPAKTSAAHAVWMAVMRNKASLEIDQVPTEQRQKP